MKPVRVAPPPPASLRGHAAGLLQEHDEEPVPGLPEDLPAGERILWQGAPDWRVLVTDAFHLRKVAVYFSVIGALRLAFLLQEEMGMVEVAKAMAPFVVLALSGVFIIWSLAWLSARHTLYTITNRRVVMRIGIVLTVTFNIPFQRITGAHLRAITSSHGDVALDIEHTTRIPYLQLWPHARAWHLRQPQPTLRALAQAEQVAGVLTQAWSQMRGVTPRVVDQQLAGESHEPDSGSAIGRPAHQA